MDPGCSQRQSDDAVVEGANGTAPHPDSRAMVFAAGHLLEGCDGGIYSYDPIISLWSSLNWRWRYRALFRRRHPMRSQILQGGATRRGCRSSDSPAQPGLQQHKPGRRWQHCPSGECWRDPALLFQQRSPGSRIGLIRGADANDDGQITAAERTIFPLTVEGTARDGLNAAGAGGASLSITLSVSSSFTRSTPRIVWIDRRCER